MLLTVFCWAVWEIKSHLAVSSDLKPYSVQYLYFLTYFSRIVVVFVQIVFCGVAVNRTPSISPSSGKTFKYAICKYITLQSQENR